MFGVSGSSCSRRLAVGRGRRVFESERRSPTCQEFDVNLDDEEAPVSEGQQPLKGDAASGDGCGASPAVRADEALCSLTQRAACTPQMATQMQLPQQGRRGARARRQAARRAARHWPPWSRQRRRRGWRVGAQALGCRRASRQTSECGQGLRAARRTRRWALRAATSPCVPPSSRAGCSTQLAGAQPAAGQHKAGRPPLHPATMEILRAAAARCQVGYPAAAAPAWCCRPSTRSASPLLSFIRVAAGGASAGWRGPQCTRQHGPWRRGRRWGDGADGSG